MINVEEIRRAFALFVEPDDDLSGAERARRLAHARKAHLAQLLLKSAQARRRKAARRA